MQPIISIIINFYNMRREAARTLYSLSTSYQRGVSADDYEIIAIDNGSTEPLDPDWVCSQGKNIHYLYYPLKHPSPCAAINHAVHTMARGKYVCICIDGARILSPGILFYMLAAIRAFPHSFTYTVGMHIGHEVQNKLVEKGYDQHQEDKLINTVDWQKNGYELFKISSFAYSSRQGFFGVMHESNCFALEKNTYQSMGGYNERFISKGGGICNHDLFNRAQQVKDIAPIRLLGEATFHQFHGGVATNVKLDAAHPYNEFCKEYKNIYGTEYKLFYREPCFIGDIQSTKFFIPN